MESGMLDVVDVSIQFGGLKVLQNVGLQVKDNELVGLIGPNGAGKTTLFNLITRIYCPTSGSIRIHGMDISKLQAFDIPNKCHAARTFQNIRLFRDLSVLDNVLVASHLKIEYGLYAVFFRTPHFVENERVVRDEAFELLKIFHLEGKADELAKNLPYGDQRKLEIVRALATKPKLLFLDEPAAGMNDRETAELLDLVRFIRQKYSLGILVIEHDMKFIMGLCERIYVLDHGQMIAMGTPAEIRNDSKVIRAYLGEETES
jgi:branched-chain amino acid transport system ATP-binding protein